MRWKVQTLPSQNRAKSILLYRVNVWGTAMPDPCRFVYFSDFDFRKSCVSSTVTSCICFVAWYWNQSRFQFRHLTSSNIRLRLTLRSFHSKHSALYILERQLTCRAARARKRGDQHDLRLIFLIHFYLRGDCHVEPFVARKPKILK
jgi:hypothetical protein